MILGEWWAANPTGGGKEFQPPDPAERLPGTLREIARGEFVLETIGFLGDRPFIAGGPQTSSDRSRLEIWGMDRKGNCYSLLDNLRARSAWSPSHVSDGHEDWSVGWLTKGNAWVTSDEECTRARIRIDDLPQWALWRQPDNIEFDYDRATATIGLRDETLCETKIGGTGVSLVHGSATTIGLPGQDPERHFTLVDTVYWEVKDPVSLRAIVEEWIGHFESFSRFMTMQPSVVSRIDCYFSESDDKPLSVELIARRLERPRHSGDRDADRSSPHDYLTTLRTLQEQGINPADVLAGYWRAIATGDAYMAMVLHLESQDRLLNRGPDGALLNAIRSVESLYAANNPGARVETIPVQQKIEDAVTHAGDVGAQIVDAWPEVHTTGELRRHVAHGKARPSTRFGLRCLGGAMALQWIQRCRLLAELGIDETVAHSIVSTNYRYPSDLKTLQNWNAEIRE